MDQDMVVLQFPLNYNVTVSRVLSLFKLFFFFFFAAFGSLFPLISIYFKQLGMSAFQSGVLVGIRPFVEFFSAPFWSGLAKKWRNGRTILLFSLVCWVLFTIGLGFITPTPEGCLISINGTKMHRVADPYKVYPKGQLIDMAHKYYEYNQGESPVRLDHTNIINKDADSGNLIVPLFGTVVYSQSSVNIVFVKLLFLILIGEFLSSPTITLTDSVVLNYLDNDIAAYGRQRMFGSLGWGLTMFIVGIALDYSTIFLRHPCGWAGSHEKNYVICFTVFVIFMCMALITATKFTFTYDVKCENMYIKLIKDKFRKVFMGGKLKNRGKLVNESESMDDFNKIPLDDPAEENGIEHFSEQPLSEPIVKDPLWKRWLTVLKMFGSIRPAAFLFVSWFMGFGMGVVFTFLFWHLQEIGGSPSLFGIASVINHLSEILAYYFSGRLIALVGHLKVLYLGLLGNIIRFMYVSYLIKPWWVLPFELLQGLTHAAVWAACCSYLTQKIPEENRSSAQSLLQAIHHGLGKGFGGVLGGYLTSRFGSGFMFRAYGVACCVVLIIFLLLNYLLAESLIPGAPASQKPEDEYNMNEYGSAAGGNIGDQDDSRQFLGDSIFLSPHGIPFAPPNREQIPQNRDETKDFYSQPSEYIAPGAGIRPQPAPELFATPPVNKYQPY